MGSLQGGVMEHKERRDITVCQGQDFLKSKMREHQRKVPQRWCLGPGLAELFALSSVPLACSHVCDKIQFDFNVKIQRRGRKWYWSVGLGREQRRAGRPGWWEGAGVQRPTIQSLGTCSESFWPRAF